MMAVTARSLYALQSSNILRKPPARSEIHKLGIVLILPKYPDEFTDNTDKFSSRTIEVQSL